MTKIPYPPIPFPSSLHIIHLPYQIVSITNTTTPSLTFLETMINLKNYYSQGIMGECQGITSGVIRDILLTPTKVGHLFSNMQKGNPEELGRLVLAHIPMIQDVEMMSIAGIVLRWWMVQLKKQHSLMVIPWELQFLSDLENVLPQERKVISITDIWRTAQAYGGTNSVKLFQLEREAKQIAISCAWGIKKGSNKVMFGLKIKLNNLEMFSPYL